MSFCGCCGRVCRNEAEWCFKCRGHVVQDADLRLPPWERTFGAQHGTDCPYEVDALDD